MEPFTTTYFENELARIKYSRMRHGNLKIVFQYISELVECYMYVERKHMSIPVLTEDGEVWMSITPFEIESHYMPIQLAKGRVGVGGLGLGYYTQRILEKEDVQEVVVFEKNEKIIELYTMLFGTHEKLKIEHEDVRQLRNQQFDFFYNDIYPGGVMREMIADMSLLTKHNDLKLYHFWTIEQMIFEIAEAGLLKKIPIRFRELYMPFIERLKSSKTNLKLLGLGDEMYEEFKKHKLF